jgi:ketopantoate reductase
VSESRLRIGIVGKGALGLGLQNLLNPFFDVSFSVTDAHLVFFCVKSYQLEKAIQDNISQIPKEAPSISLSNGWIEPLLPSSFRLGIATVAFTKSLEGKVTRKDNSGTVVWGPLEEGISPSQIERLVFSKLPLFSWTETPRLFHRQKWLFNTSLNCALASLGLSLNGEILQHLSQLQLFFDEAFSLGELKWGKWEKDKGQYWNHLLNLISDTANNQNSMTADIAQKRKTEIEHLAGLAMPYSGFPTLKAIYCQYTSLRL